MFQVYDLQNVSVLNGGLAKWVAEGRPTHTDSATEDDFKVTFRPEFLKTFPQIVELEKEIAEGKSQIPIIDARSQPYYEAGHIPISKNLPFKSF
jgi:thiosulfate/3-mercaptopyruvate sulfurtransferase